MDALQERRQSRPHGRKKAGDADRRGWTQM